LAFQRRIDNNNKEKDELRPTNLIFSRLILLRFDLIFRDREYVLYYVPVCCRSGRGQQIISNPSSCSAYSARNIWSLPGSDGSSVDDVMDGMGITITTAVTTNVNKNQPQQTITTSFLLFPVGKIPELGGSYT
jgi:hypothetical protein